MLPNILLSFKGYTRRSFALTSAIMGYHALYLMDAYARKGVARSASISFGVGQIVKLISHVTYFLPNREA